METVFFLIYFNLLLVEKKHSFKINMNMTQNYTLTYIHVLEMNGTQAMQLQVALSDVHRLQ